jgi:hypothetical protein
MVPGVAAWVAFAEIEDLAPQSLAQGDSLRVAVEALTRTAEAVQRAQVERERAQAARERELMQVQIEAHRALIEGQKAQMQLVVSLFERLAARAYVPGGQPLRAAPR